MMLRTVVVALALLAGHATGGKIACDEVVKPNVLIFYTDDQGYGERSKYNSDILTMPNLESLGEGGIEYTNGHSAATVCTPSRFAILTGTYAFRANPEGGAITSDAPPMIPGYATLATLFKSVGYQTYMSGKWHLGMSMPEDLATGEIEGGPADAGFDKFFGIPASMNYGNLAYIRDRSFTEPPDMLTEKDWKAVRSCPTRRRKDCKTFDLKFPYSEDEGDISVGSSFRADYCLSNFTYEAMQMIEDHASAQSTPFFMYLAVTAPHLPHAPHPDFAGRNSYGAYADFLEEIDHRLGQIVQKLKDLRVYENTLIVYTSDNGTEDKVKYEKTGLKSTYIYRGEKRNLYEGGHRVPFIMHWPNGIEAGTTWDEPVSQVDLYATFAQMTGASTGSSLDGRDSFSIWQTMCDVESAANVRDGQPLIIEDDYAKLAITCDGIKYNPQKGKKLFDLNKHIKENKSSKFRGKTKKLGQALISIVKEIEETGHSNATICP